MSKTKVTRRRFLRGLAAVAGGTVLAACTPQVVEKIVDRPVIQTVVVEKAVEVERVSTVIVEKAVSVDRPVVQTVVVDRPVEVEKRVVETVLVEKAVEVEKIVEVEKLVTAAPAPMEPVTIRAHYFENPDTQRMHVETFKPFFEKEGPDKVTLEPQPYSNLRAGLLQQLAAGDPPDCYWTLPFWDADLIGNGTFLLVDDVYDFYDITPDKMAEVSWGQNEFLGHMYGFPTQEATVFYHGVYRQDHFDEAGVPYPPGDDPLDSYGQLYEMSKQLMVRDASGNVTRWGWDSHGWWANMRMLGGIMELGGQWFDHDKQEFTLTTDEVVETIKVLYFDPIEEGVTWDAARMPEEGMPDRFVQGVVPWNWTMYPLNFAVEEEDVLAVTQTYMTPSVAGKGARRYLGTNGGWNYHVIRAAPAKHHQAACRFASMPCRSLEVGDGMFETWKASSPLKAWGESRVLEDYRAVGPVEDMRVRSILMQYQLGVGWAGWEWGVMSNADFIGTGDVQTPLLEGTITPEEAAEMWQEKATTDRAEFYSKYGM